MSGVLYDKVALIGVGLIGGSIALAARRAGLARRIVGYARTEPTRQRAREIGFCDAILDTAEEAAKDADLVILCTPVGALGETAAQIRSVLKPGATLSDVGSVKAAVVRDVGPHVPEGVHFIPAHPIAGTEYSGPDAAFADLYQGRWCVLTPIPGTDESAVKRLESFWAGMGSKVDAMEARHHDLVLAITSHLPHLIAYNIVGTAADLETVTQMEVIKYSAGGFRDFTRIAASDPTMWRDIFLNNREAVLEILGRFTEDLALLQRAIRWGDGDTLFNLFTRTREIRRGVILAGQDVPVSNFGRDKKA